MLSPISLFRDLAAALERKRKFGIDALQYIVGIKSNIYPMFIHSVISCALSLNYCLKCPFGTEL